MMDMILNFDAQALLWIQAQLRVPVLSGIMIFFSIIGNSGLVWIAAGLALLIPKRTRLGGLCLLTCLLGAFLVNDILIKPLVARVRPYDTIPALEILVAPLSSFSFPSGHTNASFAAAYALTFSFGKKGALAYLPALLIAFSRCYVGVHYPTDVLMGALVGTASAVFVCAVWKWQANRRHTP